jgi:heme oxygenase
MNDDDTDTLLRGYNDMLEANRRLITAMRQMTRGTSDELRKLVRTEQDDDQREGLLRLVGAQQAWLNILEKMALEHIINDF